MSYCYVVVHVVFIPFVNNIPYINNYTLYGISTCIILPHGIPIWIILPNLVFQQVFQYKWLVFILVFQYIMVIPPAKATNEKDNKTMK